MMKKCGLIIFLAMYIANTFAQDTCKFMSYNVLNFDNSGNNKESYLRTVIGSVHPDILVVQELIDVTGANRLRDSVILKIDTNYAMGTFLNSYDTDNGIFYNKAKFIFISNTPIKTDIRDINEFKLKHKGSEIEFYIYSVHLKASSGSSNEVLRKLEVDSLRKVTALLPDSAYYIVSGDFNIYDSNEDPYIALLDSSTNGFFVDPLDGVLTTTWNNSSNAIYHTQSTRTRAFGGGSTGGMDDRFDMMLFSKAIHASGGMEYLTGSLTAIGNDGAHYNDSINSLPNAAVSVEVANALHYSSDHIPISEQFIFPVAFIDTMQNAVAVIAKEPLLIFPNPVFSQFTIKGITSPTLFYITNVNGEIVKSFESGNAKSIEVDITELEDGIYFIISDSKYNITHNKIFKISQW